MIRSEPRRRAPALRRTVAARFPDAEGVFDAIVPPKGELRIVKVAAPSRMSIYLSEARGMGAQNRLLLSGAGSQHRLRRRQAGGCVAVGAGSEASPPPIRARGGCTHPRISSAVETVPSLVCGGVPGRAQGKPVFIDTSSKGDVIPTVNALWRAPGILPAIYLKHHSVSHFLLSAPPAPRQTPSRTPHLHNQRAVQAPASPGAPRTCPRAGGADLMLPGCAAPLPRFEEGGIVAVFVRGNPAAVVRFPQSLHKPRSPPRSSPRQAPRLLLCCLKEPSG